MDDNTNTLKKRLLRKPSRKACICFLVVLLLVLLAYLFFFQGLSGLISGTQNVGFVSLNEDAVPQMIIKDVIPEYRELERALGCVSDGKVYVIVTRGEKPTAGYDLSIEKIQLQKTEKGSNMVVTALFKEPTAGETVSRIITYPYAVAKTDLDGLPDTIELNIKYEE